MAEPRLIDANEAIEKINGLCVDGNENWIGTDNQSFVDHADVIDILSSIPTVDAVPVVHGQWIEDTYSNSTYDADCSVCGEKIKWNGCMYDFNYCPNCGAKMDGGKENGTAQT